MPVDSSRGPGQWEEGHRRQCLVLTPHPLGIRTLHAVREVDSSAFEGRHGVCHEGTRTRVHGNARERAQPRRTRHPSWCLRGGGVRREEGLAQGTHQRQRRRGAQQPDGNLP
eukprot:scaffold938_cov334-Pavlova_lutheri.AAC.53